MEIFKYLGAEFKPVRQFTRSEDFTRISKHLECLPRPYGTIFSRDHGKYRHEDFYKAAGGKDVCTADVFLLVDLGVEVVPCGIRLFKYSINN